MQTRSRSRIEHRHRPRVVRTRTRAFIEPEPDVTDTGRNLRSRRVGIPPGVRKSLRLRSTRSTVVDNIEPVETFSQIEPLPQTSKRKPKQEIVASGLLTYFFLV